MSYVNISNHTESYLTASTLSSMISKTKEIQSNYFAVTENGTLVSALKAYYAAKNAKLSPILGIDLFFKDENCPIISGTPSDQSKYFKLLMYFKDQSAYQEMVKMISDPSRKKVKIGEDHQFPLFNWSDLERLSKFNVSVSTSNVEDIVSKHLIFNRPDLSKKYYQKMVDIFGNNYTPALNVYEQTHFQERLIQITLSGNMKIKLPLHTRVETDSKGFKNKAIDIYKFGKRHKKLLVIYYNGLKSKIKVENQQIVKVEMVKEFVQIATGDVQLAANKFFLENHKGPLLLSSYAYYSNKDDKIVQNLKLGEDGKFLHQDLYIRAPHEVALYLKNIGLEIDQIRGLFSNTIAWARDFDDFKIKYDINLVDYGPKPEKLLMEAIQRRGRMRWDDPRYVSQLKQEIDLLVNNGVVNLCPYFLPLIEISDYYVKNDRLPGPARGSAGGFLVSYLAGITQIDPIKYGLSTERFLTKDRVQQGNFPDIDWDSEGRELLVGDDGNSGYLKSRFGNKYAQISTRGLLRVKSAILDANRFLHGEVQPEIQKLSKSLPNTPQGISDHDFLFGYESNDEHVSGLFETNEDLKKYAEERPKEWELVKKAVSLTRQMGRHACAWVLSSDAISNIVPITEIGGVEQVTQFEAKECEKAGLVKYDFLVVSAIKDIRVCIEKINERHGDKLEVGYFKHEGSLVYAWDLPEVQGVYDMMSDGETETVFQFNTTSVTPFVQAVKPNQIEGLSAITALVRPGPLDYVDPNTGRNMAEEYVERKFGRSKGDIEILSQLIPETYGVLIYQEQITKIAKELGKMSVVDAENVRIAMGKKKLKLMDSLKPVFVEGAKQQVGEETALKIWDMMATFGRYGFNKAHSTAYAVIGYACAFLKYHYPLEWWAAVLTHAETKEINEVFYKYVKDIMLPPDINLSKEEITIDYENKKLRQKLSAIAGLGDKVVEKIVAARPFKDLRDFAEKKPCGPSMTRKLIYIGALDSLMPSEANSMLKKMWTYEETVKQIDYDEKLANLRSQPHSEEVEKKIEKLVKAGRAKAKIDPYYTVVDPLKDYLIKKEICPTMNMDLYEIIKKYSKNNTVMDRGNSVNILDARGREVRLAKPNILEALDTNIVDRDVFFCVPAYVMKSEEFPYAKNSKKALKMVVDSSGYISEKVVWPDYNTGELIYPKALKKGCLAFIFYHKKPQRDGVNIYDISVEVEGIDED